MAAGQPRGGTQGQCFDAGYKTVCALFYGEALEHAVIVRAPACLQLDQRIVGTGFGGDIAATAAEQVLHDLRVAAQEGGGLRVKDAEAPQQRVGGVGAAGDFRAVQAQGLGVQGFALGAGLLGLHRLDHVAHGHWFGVIGQVGDGKAEAGAAEQNAGQCADQFARMACRSALSSAQRGLHGT